jgi:hypothetical protein
MKEKEVAAQNEQFLVQVGTLPVVHSALGQLLGIYARTKDSNRLVKFTCETAELGMTVAVNTAKPVLNRLPVDRLNSVACSQLDNMKKSYPVITKPTEEVLSDTYQLYAATLKPTVDRINSIKDTGVKSVAAVGQYGVDKVNGVTSFTKGAVVGAKDFGMRRVQAVKDRSLQTVGSLMATRYGVAVTGKVDNWVEVADGYVEKYLPPAEDEEMATCPSEADTLRRVGIVSEKAGRRVLSRAARDVQAYRKWMEDHLANLGITLELINVAKTNLDAARSLALSQAAALGEGTRHIWEEMQKPGGSETVRKELWEKVNAAENRLGYIWSEIRRTDVASDDEKGMEITKFERQLIATARHLTQNLKNHFANLSSQMNNLSSVVQDRVKEAGSITNAIANIFATTNVTLKELPQIAIDNARYQLNALNAYVSDYAEQSVALLASHPNLGWMTPTWILKTPEKKTPNESTADPKE